MKQDLRLRTICFTGHRELRHRDIPARLDALLTELIKQGYRFFGAGGALGFDTEAALSVLRAREVHKHIKLILVLPYPAQDERWSYEEKKRYREILKQADRVRYTSDKYTSDCYHIRNRHLVNFSSLCIAYKYKNTGGASYTVQYALEQGVGVINIALRGGVLLRKTASRIDIAHNIQYN